MSPKYKLIEQFIRDRIAEGEFEPGALIWSESRFMRHFEVSANTVQKALAGLVREGLLYREQGKGTFVAQTLPVPSPALVVGIIVPAKASTETGFHMPLIEGYRTVLAPREMVLLFREPGRPFLEVAEEARVDAALVVTPTLADRDQLLALRERMPVVAVSSHVESPSIPYIAFDNESGAQEAVTHLIGQGHRTIVFVTDPTERTAKSERLRGYQAALREHGIVLDERYRIETDNPHGHGPGSAAHRLCGLTPCPTAAFGVTDGVASALIRGLQDLGRRVPEDVAVVGFDDLPHSRHMRPALTTVAGDLFEMGRRAVELLRLHMEQPGSAPDRVLLPTHLMVRESSVHAHVRV
ncbi:MAG: GntR family transcriptional regulator [Kiritimatiellae bacterium]|nr:GntR family transcriptional regulator [Kiritimatiellia bacterium]